MNKNYQQVAALLGYETLEEQDGHVSIKAEDLKKVDAHIADAKAKAEKADADLKAADDKAAALQAELDKAKAALAERESEIKNLKDAPGAQAETLPEEPVMETTDIEGGKKLFNAVMGY